MKEKKEKGNRMAILFKFLLSSIIVKLTETKCTETETDIKKSKICPIWGKLNYLEPSLIYRGLLTNYGFDASNQNMSKSITTKRHQ